MCQNRVHEDKARKRVENILEIYSNFYRTET